MLFELIKVLNINTYPHGWKLLSYSIMPAKRQRVRKERPRKLQRQKAKPKHKNENFAEEKKAAVYACGANSKQ